MSYFRSILWSLLVLFAGHSVAMAAGAIPLPTEATDLMRADAALADVTFVDGQTGWAVGDRGAIWHTGDGGATWEAQESGVACPLRSVCFLDTKRGWAAGGWTHPYTHICEGALLTTQDGGRNWTCVRQLVLPSLARVKFFSPQQGIVIGQPSGLYPSGVLFTEDGGRSWEPLPAQLGQAWLTGDFIDTMTGALAARSGPAAIVRRRAIEAGQTPGFGLRSLRAIRLVDQQRGFAAGDGGLFLTTSDLGKTWQTSATPLPNGAEQNFDFAALAVRGGDIWLAGTPGTRVFHSADGGATFQAIATGVSAPLRAICAVDAQTVFAVGDLGTIVASRDGGRTWTRQRAGGERGAWLAIVGEPRQIPWELIARYGASEGYLGAAEILARHDLDTRGATPENLPERAHEALALAGGCRAATCWQFPLPEAELNLNGEQLLAELNRASDGRAAALWEAHLVRSIRMWRPDVVFTHHADPRMTDPLAQWINQTVLAALEKAADPTLYVDLASDCGLAAWNVKKAYGILPSGQLGANQIETGSLDPRLGRSPADFAAPIRGIISSQPETISTSIGLQGLVDRTARDRQRSDPFAEIQLAPGGPARRLLLQPPPNQFDELRRMAQKRRNMEQVIERAEHLPGGDAALLGQLGDVTSGLDSATGARVLDQLAQRYRRSGDWRLAAETYDLVVKKYPQDPLASAAQLWLLQFYGSSEAAWREERLAVRSAQRTSAVAPDRAGPRHATTADAAAPFAVDAENRQTLGASKAERERLERASLIGKSLDDTQPLLYADPRLRFPLAVAKRKLGFTADAERWLLAVRQTRSDDAWWAAAQGERWIANRTAPSPKPAVTARLAASRPHLDGNLDEVLWLSAEKIKLVTGGKADDPRAATGMIAYDQQFVYLGLQCPKAGGGEYPRAAGPRTRDPNLSQRDRVEILLDIDRDYATYYRLAIDSQGRATDDCWGDVSWDPTWYIATGGDAERWTAEVAIPVAELTGAPPAPGHVWAMGLQRVIPNVGFQSWTQPAGPRVVPEGFGLLLFQ